MKRIAIKFCSPLNKSVAKTVKLMHKAYTDEEWLGVVVRNSINIIDTWYCHWNSDQNRPPQKKFK